MSTVILFFPVLRQWRARSLSRICIELVLSVGWGVLASTRAAAPSALHCLNLCGLSLSLSLSLTHTHTPTHHLNQYGLIVRTYVSFRVRGNK